MGRVTNAFRDAVFRRARPLSDGRMLVRFGSKDFYIMQAGELLRHRWWRTANVAIMLGVAAVLANYLVEFLAKGGGPLSGLVLAAIAVQVLTLFADSWWIRRLARHKQPDDEFDRLTETWNQIG